MRDKEEKSANDIINDVEMQKLKQGIDNLIKRITDSLYKENLALKERLKNLQDENYKLKLLAFSDGSAMNIIENFKKRDKNILS